MFAVPAVRAWPTSVPSGETIGAIVALGLLGTFLGFLCYYELLARVGAARATMVTYLLPPLALGYGALLLHEAVGLESIGAMLIVLLGVWLGSRQERDCAPGEAEAISARAPLPGPSPGPARRPRPTRPS
jgi:drug/metabolite transporter (DMT)-like permease